MKEHIASNNNLRLATDEIESLSTFNLAYPECCYLATKSCKYSNIILDAHLIIYRITNERIEIPNIIHSTSSISNTRAFRKIRT